MDNLKKSPKSYVVYVIKWILIRFQTYYANTDHSVELFILESFSAFSCYRHISNSSKRRRYFRKTSLRT